MGGWAEFAGALALFFASHALPAQPRFKAPLVARFGARGFTVAYSALSVALLLWLIAAAGRAPYVELWPFAPWQLWVPHAAMPLVCLLLALAIGAPNPLSFGGANDSAFDPARPGAVGVARHPMLWALALWAGAHLVPNGDLAHVLLFGLFAAFAFAGMRAIDARKRTQLGADKWAQLAARTSVWPLEALLDGRWRPYATELPALRLAAGVALWAGSIAAHPWIAGVRAAWPSG